MAWPPLVPLAGGLWYQSCSPYSYANSILKADCGMTFYNGTTKLSTLNTASCNNNVVFSRGLLVCSNNVPALPGEPRNAATLIVCAMLRGVLFVMHTTLFTFNATSLACMCMHVNACACMCVWCACMACMHVHVRVHACAGGVHTIHIQCHKWCMHTTPVDLQRVLHF